MNHLINWLAAAVIVIGFGWFAALTNDDLHAAEAHRQETVAAAREDAAKKARWDRLSDEAKRMTSYDRIAIK